jgi:hypothetical protein
MIAVRWQFDVQKGLESRLEEFLDVNGEWTKISRHTRWYRGSSFLRDQNPPRRYLVIEYWSELMVLEKDRTFRSNAIASLERRRDAMADSVVARSVFTALNVPERMGPAWSQRCRVAPSTRKPRKPESAGRHQ